MADNFAKIRNGLTLKGQASEPAGENGDIYYDSTLGKHRFYQNGAWVDGGSGSGLFNYVSNPDASSSAETGTSVTGTFSRTRGTTAATFSDSYFQIATGTTAASSISWALNTLQEKHNGQLMRFSARVKMPTTTGTYFLDLYDGSATVTGTEVSPASGANIKWESLFVLDMTKTYTVRLRRTAGTTNETIYVDDVTVSPELTVAGSTKTQWKDATGLISFTNSAGGALDFTRSAEKIFYAQDGENLYLRGYFAASSAGSGVLTADIICARFSGITINFSKMGASGGTTNGTNTVGNGIWSDGGSAFKPLVVGIDSTTSQLLFMDTEGDISLREGHIANTDEVGFTAGPIPISEWAGSSLTMANSQVEYAFNTNTTTSDDTTSFGYGPEGVAFGSFTSNATGVTQKRVRFQTPIQPTDKIIVEVKDASVNAWIPATQYGFPLILQGTSNYGMSLEVENSTDVTVLFGKKGARPSNATYAGDGQAWSGFTDRKWRVVKSANPIGIGAGVVTQTQPGAVERAGRLLGQADGTTIPAGYVGEATKQTYTAAATTTISTGSAFTIQPGNYMVHTVVGISTAASVTGCYGGYSTDSGATSFSDYSVIGATPNVVAMVCSATLDAVGSTSIPVNITTPTTYYPKLKTYGAGATMRVTITFERIA